MTDSLSGDLWTGERDAPADKAKAAAHTVRDRADEQAKAQSQRAADRVRQIADELSDLADKAPESSPTRSLVAKAAEGGHRAAGYLDKHGLNGLLEETQRFAKQRPAAFVGATALAGLAVGRMAKAGRDANGSSNGSSSAPGTDGGPDASGTAGGDPVGSAARHGTFDQAQRPERTGYPEV
ncbi:hypothetical protein SAMN06297387_102354 [Streptomyces zhaozhouensis]|jgi:hypothetical protein|uniref:Uncharacterized protein n=1 Tax=Streptomyces zhaozhouensis TaxID=1300267 RepID=A0A286DQL3_9ACTN|nr:hypothetical protein [Streptomyces zhaozhouensis]SOD60940.1 hypothetical protein SAMN06297387_102354 [Streptomyces zhaozhouensis]